MSYDDLWLVTHCRNKYKPAASENIIRFTRDPKANKETTTQAAPSCVSVQYLHRRRETLAAYINLSISLYTKCVIGLLHNIF